VTALVAHGHTPEAVRAYTLAQVRALLGAIERMQAQRRLGDAIAMRAAQAEGNDWRNYVSKLEAQAYGR